MSREEFWEIVERVHYQSDGDMDKKCELLERELGRLDPSQIEAWNQHFWSLMKEANSYEMWGVAAIYGESSSYDTFQDFRSSLISCGRKFFEPVLRDADNLADYDGNSYLAQEGYQYVAGQVYTQLTGDEIPLDLPEQQGPSGEHWTQDDLAKRFPRTAARYGFRT